MKIYNGSSWSEARAFRFFDGGSWTTVKRGWIFNGTSWIQHYPNLPQLLSNPYLTGNSTAGSQLAINIGAWNGDESYIPTSYTYEWRRNGVTISGATSNVYTTTTSDVGTSISAQVTAINLRGSVSYSTSNSISIIPQSVSGLSLTDITSTPSQPSTVTVTGGTNTWSASWTNTGAPTYGVRTNNGGVSYSGGTSATGYSASAGSATVWVKSINNSGTVSVSWSPTFGAGGYTVSYSGAANGSTNTSATSISFSSIPTGSNLSVTVTPYAPGNTNITGGSQSSSITLTQRESAESSGSTSSIVDPVYAPTYISFSESGFTGQVLTYPNSNFYTYPFYIVRPGATLSVSNVSANGTNPTISYQWQQNAGGGWSNLGATGSSYTISSGQGPGGIEFRCQITASNSAGSTSTTTSSTGAVVNFAGTSKAPPGGEWKNNLAVGGTLYISEPANTYGVGSSFENWSFAPTWGYDIYIYRSSTSGGTYTLHSSHVKSYNGGTQVTQTKTTTGWYYATVYTYNGNSVNGNSIRIPSSGGFQLT